MKYLAIAILLSGIYSCSEGWNSNTSSQDQKQFGFYILNGPRQGFQYVDSCSTEYNYRYYTIALTNDSSLSAELNISLPNGYDSLSSARDTIHLASKLFLLPRKLTPEKQHFDLILSKELKHFLDKGINHPETLHTILRPQKTCVITIGVLTNVTKADPTTPVHSGLLLKTKGDSTAIVMFKLNHSTIVPCGQITYIPD